MGVRLVHGHELHRRRAVGRLLLPRVRIHRQRAVAGADDQLAAKRAPDLCAITVAERRADPSAQQGAFSGAELNPDGVAEPAAVATTKRSTNSGAQRRAVVVTERSAFRGLSLIHI